MTLLKRLGLILLWALLVVLVLAQVVTFTVWQAYISGRAGALDYVLPALAALLAWGVACLWARSGRRVLLYLWMVGLVVVSVGNGLLYQYYHSMHVPLTAADLEPLLQLTWAQLISAQVQFLLNAKGLTIALAIVVVVGLATVLLVRLLAPTQRHRSVRASKFAATKVSKQGKACASTYISIGAVLACVLAGYSLPTVQKLLHLSAAWQHSVLTAQVQLQTAPKGPVVAHKAQQGELYVLVIGESQNRDFMGLYNGLFATNPRLAQALDAEQSVILTNAYSAQTDTLPSLAYALSNQVVRPTQSPSFAPSMAPSMASSVAPSWTQIVSSDFISLGTVLKAAQIHSVYLSNQNPRGLLGTDLTLLAASFDQTQYLNDAQWRLPQPDEVLIPAFKQVLAALDPAANNVVVVHLMGNQNPYSDRYGADWAQYQAQQWTVGQVGSLVPDEAATLSSYLNATAYNDMVLAQLLEVARAHSSFMGLLYFSDHGADVTAGHNSAAFSYGMARIPLFFAGSPRYAERYPEKLAALRRNRTQLWLNDCSYDLLLDLMAVESAAYRPESSLASAQFQPLTTATILVGGASLPEGVDLRADPAYQVKRQWASLPTELRDKLALHRSNSLMKFGFAHSLGVEQAEIDLSYDPQLGLCLNHDGCQVGDALLADFLQAHRPNLKQLWLDLKDLNTANEPAIRGLLTQLDEQYDLKSIALVESRYPEALPPLIAAGWRTSYYLPWEALLDERSQAKTEAQVLHNIATYGITGVSYDGAAYDWVNTRISTQQWPQLQQYLWDTGIDLGQADIAALCTKYEQADLVLVPLHTYFDH